jgi:hypothetical protein
MTKKLKIKLIIFGVLFAILVAEVVFYKINAKEGEKITEETYRTLLAEQISNALK